jgi:malate permease and related proteins
MDFIIIIAFLIGLLVRIVFKHHESIRKYTNLYLLYIGLPLLVLVSLLKARGMPLGTYFFIAALFILLFMITTYYWVSALRLPGKQKAALFLSSTFGNVGYLGIPFSQMIFGQQGAIIAAIVTVVTTLVHFSLAVWLACKFTEKKSIQLKQIINPVLIVGIVGLILLKTTFVVPVGVETLSQISTYLLLFVIGLSLSLHPLTKAYTTGFFLKFIVSGIVMFCVVMLTVGLQGYLPFIFLALMPPAFANTVIALSYKFDESFTSEFTSLATILFIGLLFIASLF